MYTKNEYKKWIHFLCTITIDKNIGIYYNNTIETTLKTNKTYNSGGFPNEKMMKRIAAATIGMAIVMTSTACSSGTGSTTAAPENKETTAVQSAAEEKKEDPAAAPEETYTLMFGHAQTETHPYQACFQEWADAVAEKTNGGLVIDLYPSNTLDPRRILLIHLRIQTQTGVTTQTLPGWVPMFLSWLCLTFLILLRPWTILMQ